VTALTPVLPFVIVLGLGGLALRSGRPRVTGPLLFALAATLMGLTGALVGVLTPITDLALVGTVYQEAQSSYLFFAGLLAGLGIALAIPAALLGVGLRRLGVDSRRQGRFPPREWKTLRDVRVLRGQDALAWARRTELAGTSALALAIVLLLWAAWVLWRFA